MSEPRSPESQSSGADPRLYLALVHYPVKDRAGATVTTSVTNLDVHDIARSARTYGVQRYFVVTPIELQHILVRRILDHWTSGSGRKRMPERWEALSLCDPLVSLEQAIEAATALEGQRPTIIATAARPPKDRPATSIATVRGWLAARDRPCLLLFGTGHGLADSVLQSADAQLEPLEVGTGYNHLSVRAAAAIYLDRLLG